MAAEIIDGKAFAARLRGKVAEEVERLATGHGLIPGLAVVLVGEDPASEVYVRSKGKQTVEVGMRSFEHKLAADTPEEELLTLIDRLNADDKVHGILVQLPLPKHMDAEKVIGRLDPAKDVDGFHILNVGLLGTGQKAMVPCTPLGCLMLLRDRLGSLSGLEAVVVGRSNIVGKPMAQLLLGESCTVTIAHSRTRDLPEVCRRADILVAAVGRPEMIDGDLDQAGRHGDRRGHQPGGARRQDAAGRRRGLRLGVAGGGGDHAGAGRRRADDHRLPAGQHADRRLPRPRPAGARGTDRLSPAARAATGSSRLRCRRKRGMVQIWTVLQVIV
jgi:methylenetetrahydrofolate dehydrogenase (NADP+) / methenyltetrahydrofolate cyclohydrolase